MTQYGMTQYSIPQTRNLPKMTTVLTFFLLTLLAVPGLQAIEVTTTADENGGNPDACAFREAVRTINDQSSFGGCTFSAGDSLIVLGSETYELSLNVGVSDRVELSKPMTIMGTGPDLTIIERTGAFDDDLLFVNVNEPGTILFEGFTLQGTTERFNSAIDFLAETGVDFILRDMVFRDNVAEVGAAFRIQGDGNSPIHLERVLFEDNTSFGSFGAGGGIDCSADESSFTPSLHLVNVIFRNNTVEAIGSAIGGGLGSEGCDLELENVTFDSNMAISTDQTSFGGGLAVLGGDNDNTITLTNVTFVNNSADIGGGLIQGEGSVGTLTVTLSNVTFADNSAENGDHFVQDAGSTSLRNVLFGPSAGDGCGDSPVLTLLGGNMDSDASCGVERTEADPGLAGALANLGGFTPVLPLVDGAAAIDAGTNVGCFPFDQRRAARPFDGDGDDVSVCDVGAFEVVDAEIFFDGFESGDTEAWSSTTP